MGSAWHWFGITTSIICNYSKLKTQLFQREYRTVSQSASVTAVSAIYDRSMRTEIFLLTYLQSAGSLGWVYFLSWDVVENSGGSRHGNRPMRISLSTRLDWLFIGSSPARPGPARMSPRAQSHAAWMPSRRKTTCGRPVCPEVARIKNITGIAGTCSIYQMQLVKWTGCSHVGSALLSLCWRHFKRIFLWRASRLVHSLS